MMDLIATSNELTKHIVVDGVELFNDDICRIMAGPCAAESRDQVLRTADGLAELGIKIFRAGLFKPRTNPYAFQGAMEEGVEWLNEVKENYGMKIITETSSYSNLNIISDVADVIQIGAKAMYDNSLLKAVGKIDKPVLLKRHFSATVEETFRMADYILLGGNRQILFCERGIRTFETASRFTLDLCGAEVMKHRTNAPIILDPSHSMGISYGVADITKACVAMGCDGILIEVHCDPSKALCDQQQAIDVDKFKALYRTIKNIGECVGKRVE